MVKKKYTLKFSTSNLANLLFIKGLFLSISSDKKHGGVMLPKKKKRFTLIRSPHVNKKSKEHFQFVKCRRLYIVFFTKEQLYELLEKVPNDVEVTVKSKN
jgi:ribosomal protein S10